MRVLQAAEAEGKSVSDSRGCRSHHLSHSVVTVVAVVSTRHDMPIHLVVTSRQAKYLGNTQLNSTQPLCVLSLYVKAHMIDVLCRSPSGAPTLISYLARLALTRPLSSRHDHSLTRTLVQRFTTLQHLYQAEFCL